MGSHCVTKWLEKHNTCPICSAELFSAPVETDEDDQVLRMIHYWGKRVVLVTPVIVLATNIIIHFTCGSELTPVSRIPYTRAPWMH